MPVKNFELYHSKPNRTCEQCSKNFRVPPSRKGKYCSYECAHKHMDNFRTRSLEEILEKYVNKTEECWLYTRTLTKFGYARVKIGDKYQMLHRLTYVHFKGEVPKGLELDHTCHTKDKECKGGNSCKHRACVNPTHLEAVTHIENVFRGRVYKTGERSKYVLN
jgi:hypothetical protein